MNIKENISAIICIIVIFTLLVLVLLHKEWPRPIPSTSSLTITHVCDERGVCCYESNRGLSCVTTTIKVVVLPGDVQDNGSQGNKPIIGEVGSRALETRVFRELNGAFVPVY